MKFGISAILVVYNEEKLIKRCLESLVDVVDEIILIHDGPCKDETLNIAKNYTNNIVIGNRKGMCEFHYIDALNMVQYEWVFRIDADEYLSKKLSGKLRSLIQTDTVDAYSFIWRIWNGDKYITNNSPRKRCLFRLTNVYYIEFPHNEFQTFGKLENSNLVLDHKPLYNNYSLNKVKDKWAKWAKVHAKYYFTEQINSYNCPIGITSQFRNRIKKQLTLAHILFCPLWFIYSTLKALIIRQYIKNIKTWKVAFFQGLYGWYLCRYIYQEKK